MKSSSSERGSDAKSFSPQGDSSNNEGKKPPGAHNRNFFVAFPLEKTHDLLSPFILLVLSNF
jgi:hypothetical protein